MRLKKGEGDFIGFVITSVMMLSILIMFISFSILQNSVGAIQSTVTTIGREIVVAESLEDAKELATEEAERILGQYSNCSKIKAKIAYAAGCETWEKGGFVKLTVSAYVSTCDPFSSKRYKFSNVVMIEKNSEEQALNSGAVSNSGTSQGNWIEILKSMGEKLKENDFTYANSGIKNTFTKAKESNKKTNCASYVSWALQEYGAIDSGQMIYSKDGELRGSDIDLTKFTLQEKINVAPEDADLQVGDICGFMINGSTPHIAVFAGYSTTNGKATWYSGGGDATVGSSTKVTDFGPAAHSYYGNVKMILRINGLVS